MGFRVWEWLVGTSRILGFMFRLGSLAGVSDRLIGARPGLGQWIPRMILKRSFRLGRPLGYLIFSLMALIRDPIY